VPIEGPQREESFWIDQLPQQSRSFGFPPAQAFTPDRWLEDGDTVSVGNEILQVLHTPGHTPGHVVFFHAPSKLAIVGDVLFAGSIGRTDFPRGNHGDLIASIRDKLWPLGDDVEFIPGHGPMSTFGEERRSNPFVADGRLMPHAWKFFLAGGFDQVRIDTAADLLNLKDLDQKLWVALSCPTTGIEFDARTLALLDSDNDGHIRAPELLAAIDWAAARLNDSQRVRAKARRRAAGRDQGRSRARRRQGPAAGGRSRWSAWTPPAPPKPNTRRARWPPGKPPAPMPAAGRRHRSRLRALAAVREKLDDFFVRCRLAAFDARAEDAMNASDDSFKALGGAALSNGHADIAALPLAKVGAGATVPLGAGIDSGINPAWAERIGAFREAVVVPLLGARPGFPKATGWRCRTSSPCSAPGRPPSPPACRPKPKPCATSNAWRATCATCCRWPTTSSPSATSTPARARPLPDRHALPRRPRRRTGDLGQ
jgi:hypothetical protein